MNSITSTTYSSDILSSITSNISTDIISQNDSDSDGSLTSEELGIDEDIFSSLDSDSDGLVTQDEIASAIDSELSNYSEMPTPDEFASLLSGLGLEMPTSTEQTSETSDFVSELMSAYDTDGNSTLTADEVSLLNEDEFAALDADGDGAITTEELSSAVDEVANGDSSTEEASTATAAAGGGGGVSASSEEEEEYDELDTNEDGVVSYEERMAGLGIDINETSDSSSSSDTTTSAQDSIKMLFDAIKSNSGNSEEDAGLENFSSIMKMSNNQNNTTELNSYVNNLSDRNSSLFGYA